VPPAAALAQVRLVTFSSYMHILHLSSYTPRCIYNMRQKSSCNIYFIQVAEEIVPAVPPQARPQGLPVAPAVGEPESAPGEELSLALVSSKAFRF